MPIISLDISRKEVEKIPVWQASYMNYLYKRFHVWSQAMSSLTSNKTEVLVVGAGPVGLTMACELLRHGVSCRIIDKNQSATHESRALAIQARTLEVFKDIEIIDEVLLRGKITHGINAYTNKRHIAHIEFKLDNTDTPYPFLVILPQSDTEEILNNLLIKRGLKVERQVELKTFSQDERGVTAILVDGQGQEQTVDSHWLIGCDGAHSTVRHALNLPFPGSEYPEEFLLADVQLDWKFPDDEAHIFLTPEHTLAAFPCPTSGFWRVINTKNTEESDNKKYIIEQIQDKIQAQGVEDVVVSNPIWTSVFRVHRRIASQFRVGRCFLCGDAAHIHSPAGGQGMNIGIQDAHNLAWKLSLAIAQPAQDLLLDSYQAERYPVAAAVLSGSDLFTKAMTLGNPLSQHLRNQLLSFLTRFDWVQKHISKTLSELGFNYRKSPIVAEDRLAIPGFHPFTRRFFAAAPHSGYLAPDVLFRESSNTQPQRLFEILKGTQHHLLLFVGKNPNIESYEKIKKFANLVNERYAHLVSVVLILPNKTSEEEFDWSGQKLIDTDGTLYNHYGAGSECLYLIRPDRYIGYRSQAVDTNKFFAYLQQLVF
jgi:2-polyprenyl-6-methoxyphenol hydroxylase-like FAD-dependent oxidoreductase